MARSLERSSRFIHQASASYAPKKDIYMVRVANLAIVPAKVKFSHVPLQMLFTYVMESSDQAALQEAEA